MEGDRSGWRDGNTLSYGRSFQFGLRWMCLKLNLGALEAGSVCPRSHRLLVHSAGKMKGVREEGRKSGSLDGCVDPDQTSARFSSSHCFPSLPVSE